MKIFPAADPLEIANVIFEDGIRRNANVGDELLVTNDWRGSSGSFVSTPVVVKQPLLRKGRHSRMLWTVLAAVPSAVCRMSTSSSRRDSGHLCHPLLTNIYRSGRGLLLVAAKGEA